MQGPTPLLDGFPTLEAFLGRNANQLLVDVLSLIPCSDGDLI